MVKIMIATDTGMAEAGTITLGEGDELEFAANTGFESVMESLKEHEVYDQHGGDELSADDDPKRWLQMLPDDLGGSSRLQAIEVEHQ